MAPAGRVPVTVLTGYLGAGKTSVLNHLLAARPGRYAVIVNEFGAVGVDGALVESGAEELIELSSGCLCCVVRGDLIRTMRTLLAEETGLDGILIETTGVANPSPVIQTFLADQVLSARCRLDAVVTVADCLRIADQVTREDEAADQVALASILLLNKSLEGDAEAAEVALRRLNPLAPVHRIERGRIDPALVLDTGGYDLDRAADLPRPLDEGGREGHTVAAGLSHVCMTAERPVDAEALERWLTDLLSVRGEQILRTKGILEVKGEERKLVVQAVNMALEGDFCGRWPAGPRQSRLVFIGRALDRAALEAGFLSCLADQQS